MRINLYLDDLRPAPLGWYLAKTVEQAKLLMLAHDVENLSLDHDLGHADGCLGCTQYQELPHTDAPNGKHFVLWMIENDLWPHNRPTVHSQNPVGKETMEGLISRYGPYRQD